MRSEPLEDAASHLSELAEEVDSTHGEAEAAYANGDMVSGDAYRPE